MQPRELLHRWDDRVLAPGVLDGGTATTLAASGHDLSGPLWSARLLFDAPGAVQAVHEAFLRAGADVVTTVSYQLAARSMAAAGQDPAATPALLARSVEVARTAVQAHRARGHPGGLVGASVGPYAATLGGGVEYRGDDARSVTELRRFHTPRVAALVDAGADLLVCETIPTATELAALALVLADVPIATIVTATLTADGRVTADGQPLARAFAPLLEVEPVVAIGVNCGPPALVMPALQALAPTGLPLVARPNAGGRWEAATDRWLPTEPAGHAELDPAAWVRAGARLVGGCCGTAPADLQALVARLAIGS